MVERCENCNRIISDNDFVLLDMRYCAPAQDYGQSHNFCQACLDAAEITTARELAEWDYPEED